MGGQSSYEREESSKYKNMENYLYGNSLLWGAGQYILVILIGLIAVLALVFACIAFQRTQNDNDNSSSWEHPAGKMQLPTNDTNPMFAVIDMEMQLTGFVLVFGRDMTIASATALVPTGGFNGTYHFDFQVIVEAPILLKKRSSDIPSEKIDENVHRKRQPFESHQRNFKAWLTIDGVNYINGGWAQDDSVYYVNNSFRPNKRASLTLSGLVFLNSGQNVGIRLVAPDDCTDCSGEEFINIYDGRLNLFLQHNVNSALILMPLYGIILLVAMLLI